MRLCIEVIRGVLEPLGCTVTRGRHKKHLIMAVDGPAGQRGHVSISTTPRNKGDNFNVLRQDAQRLARSWGLVG